MCGLRQGVPAAFASPGSDVLQRIDVSTCATATLATQRAKRQSDADYRENQARAQRAWVQRHRDYWRAYRRTHPQYRESNRLAARQRRRERRRGAAQFAKMDASTAFSHVPSGTYRLVPASAAEFAKMDAWIVEMTLISRPYGEAAEVCKEST